MIYLSITGLSTGANVGIGAGLGIRAEDKIRRDSDIKVRKIDAGELLLLIGSLKRPLTNSLLPRLAGGRF